MPPRILFTRKGKGEIKYKNLVIKADFKLEFYIGSDTVLYLYKDVFSRDIIDLGNELAPKKSVIVSLRGILDRGNFISIDELILVSPAGLKKGKSTPLKFKTFSPVIISSDKKKSISSYSKIRILITNLEFSGCDRTITKKSSKLDRFSINIKGYEIVLKQVDNYKKVIESLRKGKYESAITTEVIIKTGLKNSSEVFRIVDNICRLLTIANGNTIVPVTTQHFNKNKRVWSESITARVEKFRAGDQLIPTFYGEHLREFLKKTYLNYEEYKNAFGLNVISDYYILMKSASIMDIRCLMGFVLLECLTSHAEEYYNNKGEPVKSTLKRGKIKKLHKILPQDHNLDESIIDEIIEEFVYPYPSLKDFIDRIMKQFGMKYKKGEDKLFSLRKEFIHKGMYPKATKEHLKIYRLLVHFIDRLLLCILGYSGPYLNIANAYREENLKEKK